MPNKRGSLRVYKESYPDELVELMANGALDCEVFAKWNICKDTFYRWINENADFKAAYEEGLPKCEAWWIDWGRRGMKGEIKGFTFNAWIAFMNNKFKWAKISQESQNVINNVTISNLNVLQQKSNLDLVEYIKMTVERNKDVIECPYIKIEADESK